MWELLTYALGRGQTKYLVPFPETPIPVRCREEVLSTFDICYRFRAKASSRTLPKVPRHNLHVRALQTPSTLWRQYFRYSRSDIHGALQGARRSTILCVPGILRRIVDAGRILVLLTVHPFHVGCFREHSRLATSEDIE